MDLQIKRVKEHYEIYVNDEFYCSCDNYTELQQEIKALEEKTQ